jgi:response regulator RpfG family c-di-GMP phosphodiesterase
MMRTGRILLVEPEDDFRRDLDRQLDQAGHDVAAVPDPVEAAQLLEEGLDPDVVVLDAEDVAGSGTLHELAPRAVVLRIDRALDRTKEFDSQIGEFARCAPHAGDVLRCVEELLLRHHPSSGADDGSRCLDLTRRLANALPRARTTEERIDLVTETFDTFFGVRGTLVVRRGPGPDEWIEATQGLSGAVAERISEEITVRSRARDIRPFLTRFEVDGRPHEVACLAVTIGDQKETDLALELERAPAMPGHREALMNLVGSAVRASATAEELSRARSLLEIQDSSFAALLETSRELAKTTSYPKCCRRVLAILRSELDLTPSALLLVREEGHGGMELAATNGVAEERLERIGLTALQGVGRACLASRELQALDDLGFDAVVDRERELLIEIGLRWVVPLASDDDRPGLLFFGRNDQLADPPAWERKLLLSILGAAAVSLRSLRKIDDLATLSAGTLRGMVSATELQHPWDRGHAERVARMAMRMGRALEMSDRALRDLSLAGLMHDVGKGGAGHTSSESGDATDPATMHPVVGSTILSRGRHSAAVIHGVEQHHERFDGEGLPFGLHGEAIHLFARILAIANAYDRMTRSSEKPLSTEDAIARLERGAGLLYDPGLVAVFVEQVRRETGDDHGPSSAIWLRRIVGVDDSD